MPKIKDLPNIVSVLKEGAQRKFVVLKYEDYKKFIASLDIQGSIDEKDYLSKYEDVRKAVTANAIPSGTDHYKRSGYVEQRKAVVLP